MHVPEQDIVDGIEVADKLFDTVLGEQAPCLVAFPLWVDLVHILLDSGWSEKDLMEEVVCVTAVHQSAGTA